MPATVAMIRIRAVPNGRRAEVIGRYGDAWKVRVTAAPEKGRANEELVRLLSEVLDVQRARIDVVRGQGSRDKTVAIQRMDATEAEARLARAAAAQ
jgi:uncharacterized protein (TIGR00251 family)